MKPVRVAAVQAAPAFLDLDASLALLETWARRARDCGATVIVFPETWLSGYPAWLDVSPGAALWDHDGAKRAFARLFDSAVEVPGAAVARIGTLAGELGAAIVVGANERAGRTIYNALLTFTPDGRLANHHRKLVPTFSERMVWGQGDAGGLRTVEAGGARLGGLVCWEHWMPLARQALHDAGEQIHAAVWPGVKEMHQVASRHYAFEGRCFVVAAGSVLRADRLPPELPAATPPVTHPAGLLLAGGSAIIAPDGRYLAGPVADVETVVWADCDLEEITRESQTLDVSGHYSRRDVFEFGLRPGQPAR